MDPTYYNDYINEEANANITGEPSDFQDFWILIEISNITGG